MQRSHFDTEHNLFRDAFAAFLDKEVVPHQEAWEEAGVKGAISDEPVGSYHYLKGLAGGMKVDCRVRVFPLVVDDVCKNFPEKGERRAEWVDCAEAANRVQEPGLKTLLLAFERKILSEIAAIPKNGPPDA